ncbi:MAG: hypothetical protein E5Y88_28980 [Mesorhizobium sp.]|nr:MAG: hypothetical protein E5Y88_28980 [Mesorhizobium sp.]
MPSRGVHPSREIGKLGHTVRLIPPSYVKPFVKRQKMGWVAALPRRHRNVPRSWCSTPRGEDGK